MTLKKNKIVFISVLAVLFLFLISYTILIMDDSEENGQDLKQTVVPELEKDLKTYTSKLDALDNLKEARETTVPSIYSEKFIDSLGYYDPKLDNKEKKRVVDSIYAANKIKYTPASTNSSRHAISRIKEEPEIDSTEYKNDLKIKAQELGLEHQLFFASAPKINDQTLFNNTDKNIVVVVDGNQVVKAHSRLRMRLTKDTKINNVVLPKNTVLYGFISFKPNRAMIKIENIQSIATSLKAFDIDDGAEGIYVENNFRSEATEEIVDDVIQDINIPSVPQVNGITKVLRRSNRHVKVTILNNYKLLLKPKP